MRTHPTAGSSLIIRSTRATDGGAHGSWRPGSATSPRETRQFQLGFAAPNVAAKTATEFAAGVNWYLTANVKWQFDYANTYFDGGAGVTAPRSRTVRTKACSSRNCKSPSGARNRNVSSQIRNEARARRRRRGGERCSRRRALRAQRKSHCSTCRTIRPANFTKQSTRSSPRIGKRRRATTSRSTNRTAARASRRAP